MSTDSSQPDSVNELIETIREYVKIAQKGSREKHRDKLYGTVWELSHKIRPKYNLSKITLSDGGWICEFHTYKTGHKSAYSKNGRVIDVYTFPLKNRYEPSDLDKLLDDLDHQLSLANYEAQTGQRGKDINGKVLPCPATDRLIDIANELERDYGHIQHNKKKRKGVKKKPANKSGRKQISGKDAENRTHFYDEAVQRKHESGTPLKEVAADWGITYNEAKAWMQWKKEHLKKKKE